MKSKPTPNQTLLAMVPPLCQVEEQKATKKKTTKTVTIRPTPTNMSKSEHPTILHKYKQKFANRKLQREKQAAGKLAFDNLINKH